MCKEQDQKFGERTCEKCNQPMLSGWDCEIDQYWYKCIRCNILISIF